MAGRHYTAPPKPGEKPVVQWLVDMGKAAVEAKDRYSRTPMHYAAQNGHKDVLEQLLAKATDTNKDTGIEATDDDGWTPLWYAAQNGRPADLPICRSADLPICLPAHLPKS